MEFNSGFKGLKHVLATYVVYMFRSRDVLQTSRIHSVSISVYFDCGFLVGIHVQLVGIIQKNLLPRVQLMV